MGEVVDITAKIPHVQGPAKCYLCGYKWQAVAPVGTTGLDCPSCFASRGAFEGCCIPAEQKILVCNCGCVHFFVTPNAICCFNCGLEQEFE